MAVELTKETYEAAIEASKNKPMFMDFWGPKCTHCLALMPSVEALAEKYADKSTCARSTSPAPPRRHGPQGHEPSFLPVLQERRRSGPSQR